MSRRESSAKKDQWQEPGGTAGLFFPRGRAGVLKEREPCSEREGALKKPRVKICGLTRPEDAALAAELGAWALGVIFAPESPRRLDPGLAAEVLGPAPADVERAGVFVNASLRDIEEAVAAAGLTVLQLHGEEDASFCREAGGVTGLPVIKALRVSDAASLEGVVRFDTDYVLLDTYRAGSHGGTGETFDWQLAAEIPLEQRASRIILSGGLGPENIRAAVGAVAPFAVDVSSGVEEAPGIKSADRLAELFREIEAGE